MSPSFFSQVAPRTTLVLAISVLTACGSDSSSMPGPVTPAAGTTGTAAAGAAGQAGPSVPGTGAAGVASGTAGRAAAGTGAAGSVAAGTSGRAGSAAAGAGGLAAGSGGAAAPAAGSGGASAGSGASGASGTGVAGAAAGSGGAPAAGKVFGQCRFHFGTTDGIAKDKPELIEQLDFFTPGWMGLSDTFDQQYVCDYTKPGGLFEKQVPAVVAYVAAFYAKRVGNLKDCNSPEPKEDLCVAGAALIMRDLSKIVAIYESYAKGYAACYGTTRPIIFMMEPDYFQYTISNQSAPWTHQQAGQIMSQFVNAIKKHLPNAVFSMDISPWVPPNNGEDQGRQWYSNFDMSLFTFIHTSGGSTNGNTDKIRSSNNMTWRGVSEATGKPLLADTGYSVNGSSAGHDPAWDMPVNVNARMMDGVVSISQYNPEARWPQTIASLRAQLGQPKFCP